MLAVDSSAVIAILFDEPQADMLLQRLAVETRGQRVMSVASYLETGAVLAIRQRIPKRARQSEMLRLRHQAIADLDAFLARAGIELTPVDVEQARIALRARIDFGRGLGAPAGLNFGDCFSYALAKALDAPLLYVGDDFRRTDIRSALS